MFPTHMPLFDPVHQVTSLLVSCTGDGGLLKAPVAVNGTWPLGKFRASANAGFSFTDCNWRLLPHPTIPSAMMGGTRKRRQEPKWGMATSIHKSRILRWMIGPAKRVASYAFRSYTNNPGSMSLIDSMTMSAP
jgi:hypothetical protein